MKITRKQDDGADKILAALKKNKFFCPCKLEKNDDTKCMCKEFLESEVTGECSCGLFIKEEL